MITAALLWVLTSSFGVIDGAPFDKKVSIEIEAAPAERLLPELGKACGVALRAEGSTKADVLVVSVKDVTLKDLMARIARLDSAEWRKAEDGAYELIRTADLKKKQEQEDLKNEAEVIRKTQEAYLKKLPEFKQLNLSEAKALLDRYTKLNDEFQTLIKQGYSDETMRNMEASKALREQLPLQRFIHRIMLGLDPSFLASLPNGAEATFSDVPNKVQKRLPIDLSRIYAEFMAGHQMFFEASGRKVDPNYPNHLGNELLGSRIFRDRPMKTVVVIQKYWMGISFSAILVTKEQEIETIYSESMQLVGDNVKLDNAKGPSFLESLADRPQKFMKELVRITNPSSSGENLSVNSEVKEWYLDPIAFEPLALLSGGIVTALAKSKNENLVGVLTDEIRNLVCMAGFSGDTTLVNMEKQLPFKANVKTESAGGWMEVKPIYPSKNWRERIDRRTLKSLFFVADRLAPNIDQAARFAAELSPSFEWCVPSLMGFLSPNGSRLTRELHAQYYELRFYGLLSPRQKAELAKGQVLFFRNLTPVQQQALFDAVYLGNVWLREILPKNLDGYRTPWSFTTSHGKTEQLPDGISPEAPFTMSVEEVTKVLPSYGSYNAMETYDASRVAMELALSEDAVQSGQNRREPTGYRLLGQKRLIFNFVFPPYVTGTMFLTDTERDAGGRLLKYSELPQVFRDDVNKQLEMLRRNRGMGQSKDVIKP